jgi:hypothetical protein
MRSTRALRIALLGAFLTVALAASAGAATVIHFQAESLPALKAQLHKHEVHALTFHPKAGAVVSLNAATGVGSASGIGHIHVSMNDGRYYTVVYAAGEQARLIALASADRTRYAVATVKPKAPATTHHTLRYIAGGIVIVVIVVVAAVLLVDRRRKLGEQGEGTPPPSSPSSSGDSPTPT